MQTISRKMRFVTVFLCLVMALGLITACGDDSQSDDKLVKAITLNLTEYTFTSFDTRVKLDATVSPADAVNSSLVWTNANPGVATLTQEHEVIPAMNGKTVITVATEDGSVIAMCNITVNVEEEIIEIPNVPVESVKISNETYTIEEIGASVRLSKDVIPYGATDPSVTWTTSDEAVAKVDQTGLVTAVKEGTATITVTTNDGGFTASCVITVKVPSNPDNGSQGNQSGNQQSGNQQGSSTTKFNRENIPAAKLDADGFLVSDNLEYFNKHNPDCVAWLYIPNTKNKTTGLGEINFPAAQGTNNEYYLGVGLDHKYKNEGSVVLDYRSSIGLTGEITDQNTIFYGHAKGETTFDRLEFATRSDEWFSNESNRYVYLNTLTEETVWKVFACYYTDSDDNYYLTRNFTLSEAEVFAKLATMSTSEQLEYIHDENKMKELYKDTAALVEFANGWRSRISTPEGDKEYATTYKPYEPILRNRDYGVTVGPDDKILTLSTCSSDVGSMRYVLHAVLVKSRPRTDRD